MFLKTSRLEHKLLVSINDTRPDSSIPHFTVKELDPCPESISPPVTCQDTVESIP